MSWYNPLTWGSKNEVDNNKFFDQIKTDEMNMDETPPDDPTEPWVHIKGMVHDPEMGIQIELDWNDAFVKFLRDNGITGSNDNAVVQKYLAMLHRQMLEHYQENGGDNFE